MIRFVFILAGAIGGYYLAIDSRWPGPIQNENNAIIILMILGSAIGYVTGGVLGRRLAKTLAWVDDSLQRVPLTDLVMGLVGFVVGLIIAFLVTLPLVQIELFELRLALISFAYVSLAWMGVRLGIGRGDEFSQVLKLRGSESHGNEHPGLDKLLDTNIVIDGRILDLVGAGFLEGRLLVPRFVISELHTLSDSADALKRNRARRGLDVLNSLRTDFEGLIEIVETDYPEIEGVDKKLIRMASATGAAILTNDFNLNKVASLEGIKVLNLNELANAVKPVALPGETLEIKIVHVGKEAGQGVGYLEDGTMVVVEGGSGLIEKTVVLSITSMLQTSAGKMIFAKPKAAEAV